MKRTSRILLCLFLLVIASWVVYQLFRSRIPVYQGRDLDVWLNQFAVNISRDPQSSETKSATSEARIAIREIGTNALPYLISYVKAHDSNFKTKAIFLLQKQSLISWIPRTSANSHQMAIAGFEALGSSAAPVVDTLTNLLEERDEYVRDTAARALAEIGPSAKNAVPGLVRHLSEKVLVVKLDCINALGQIRQYPETVVPALTALINRSNSVSQDPIVTTLSINSLTFFGSQAKSAVPAIIAHLNDNNMYIRETASNSLMTIDLDAAAEAGVKR